MRRPRYSGSLRKRGRTYHLQFDIDGVRYSESAKTSDKELASRLLSEKIAKIRHGDLPVKKTTVKELSELLFTAKEARLKPKSVEWMRSLYRLHLGPVFGDRAPNSILSGDIDKWVTKRKAEGASDCYVNRGLVVFKAILKYGIRNKALLPQDLPEFPPRFDEKPFIRQGFIDDIDYLLLEAATEDEDDWLRALLALGFYFGFRKNELLGMRVSQIDMSRNRITLPAGSTKNRMPRTIIFNPSGKIAKLLKIVVKDKRPEQYVFSRDGGRTPVRDFRGTWATLMESSQIKTGSGPNGKPTFHDLRRSAVTRLHAIGIPDTDAMKISGHLSRDIFERYKIIGESTARQIAAKIDPDVEQ